MRDILRLIYDNIIPDKKTCKKFNIKSTIRYASEPLTTGTFNFDLRCCIIADIIYAGTFVSKHNGLAFANYINSHGREYFLRAVIGDYISLTFNRAHLYGNMLNTIYSTAREARVLTNGPLASSVEFIYDYNDPTSIELAAEKILEILRVVREINRITRRSGDFGNVADKVKSRFNIC